MVFLGILVGTSIVTIFLAYDFPPPQDYVVFKEELAWLQAGIMINFVAAIIFFFTPYPWLTILALSAVLTCMRALKEAKKNKIWALQK